MTKTPELTIAQAEMLLTILGVAIPQGGKEAFEKPRPKVQRPVEVDELRAMSQQLQRIGEGYAGELPGRRTDLDALIAQFEQTAKPAGDELYRAGAERLKGAEYEPIIAELLKTATSPVDDELTQHFLDKYQRDIRGRLASRGLIGQGAGERVENEALLDFMMNARNTADQRRMGAASGAQALRSGYTGDALSNIEAGRGLTTEGAYERLANLINSGQTELALRQAGVPILENILYGFEGPKRMLEANLRAASKPWAEVVIGNLATVGSQVGGAAMGGGGGKGGGGGGGGGQWSSSATPPSAMPNIYQPSQATPWQNPYEVPSQDMQQYGPQTSYYGQPQQGQQMALSPWGTPIYPSGGSPWYAKQPGVIYG